MIRRAPSPQISPGFKQVTSEIIHIYRLKINYFIILYPRQTLPSEPSEEVVLQENFHFFFLCLCSLVKYYFQARLLSKNWIKISITEKRKVIESPF